MLDEINKPLPTTSKLPVERHLFYYLKHYLLEVLLVLLVSYSVIWFILWHFFHQTMGDAVTNAGYGILVLILAYPVYLIIGGACRVIRTYRDYRHDGKMKRYQRETIRLQNDQLQAIPHKHRRLQEHAGTAYEMGQQVKTIAPDRIDFYPLPIRNNEKSTRIDFASMPIPTFADSLHEGDIKIGQENMLLAWEVSQESGVLTPLRIQQQTHFIAGESGKGKSTLAANIMAQDVLMDTRFLVIDLDRDIESDRSLTTKILPLADHLLLPIAKTLEEIDAVVTLARTLFDNPSGEHVRLVVEGVPALLKQYKILKGEDKKIIERLAVLMELLGTTGWKRGITGLYMSQFGTLEANTKVANFRDACVSKVFFRLNANQAGRMNILDSEAQNELPTLLTGHSFVQVHERNNLAPFS